MFPIDIAPPSDSHQTSLHLRKTNRLKVLQLLYFEKVTNRQALSKRSGLSSATITNVVNDLIAAGMVQEAGQSDSRGGRPSATLEINPSYGYFVGVEVGETFVRSELYDFKLQQLAQRILYLDTDENRPSVIGQSISENIQAILNDAGIPENQLFGIGIGVPGITKPNGGTSVDAPNWNWHGVHLADHLHLNTHTPIYVRNGVQLMTLAEAWFGSGKHTDNMIVILMGTGVGTGIVIQRNLYTGTMNSAGEWGHTCIQLDGRPCRCGKQGCIERYIGAPGIIDTLREIAPSSPLLQHSQMETIRALKLAADRDDSIALQVIDQVAHVLGIGISNLANTLNPECVAIGGWSGLLLADHLLPRVQTIFQQNTLEIPAQAARITLTQMGEGAVSSGAASYALKRFLQSGI